MTEQFDPFDDGNEFSWNWWAGLINNAPTPEWAQRFEAWRVADLLMERFYANVGLQAIFDWEASDGPGVHLASPGCLQAPRYFGYCDGAGLATAHDLARRFNLYLDGIEVVPVCEPEPEPIDEDAEKTPGYYPFGDYIAREELFWFGLNYEDVEPGHEECPHRDGMSPEHRMFRLAVLARLYRWSEDDFERGFIASVPSRASRRHDLTAQVVLKTGDAHYSWLSNTDGRNCLVPGVPPAYIVYVDSNIGIRLFRTDGIMEGGHSCDLGTEWLSCDSASLILRGWIIVD